MASYVYVKNPNGTTHVYQNESYWDKAEQKTKHHRKCVGKLHPETNELIPSRKKSITTDPDVPQTEHCTVLTTGSALLLDKAAHETGIDKVLQCHDELTSHNEISENQGLSKTGAESTV